MQFDGKVAVVTGGSRGIGAAITRRLAAGGADVAIVTRGRERGEAAAAAIREAGGSAQWFAGDTADFAQMHAMAARVAERLGGADILVASGSPTRPSAELFLDTDPDDFPAYFVRQCVTRLNPLRALADQMIAKGKGKVVFLTTDAGRVPTPSESLIGAGAAALIFATRALARELGRHGIRVNTVSTTLTRNTPAYERFTDKANQDKVLNRAFSKIEQRAAFGLNDPDDVAAAVEFFAGDASDQISGATISVNGGLSFP